MPPPFTNLALSRRVFPQPARGARLRRSLFPVASASPDRRRSRLEIYVAPTKRCGLARPTTGQELERNEGIPEGLPGLEVREDLVALFGSERVWIFTRNLRPGDQGERITKFVAIKFTCVAVESAKMPVDEVSNG